jgi:O-antigen/teichoic acid export membrane protein
MSVRNNSLFNLLGAIVPIAVSLVTLPIYLATIGEARYGILAVAWLLLGYFGLFDLGLGRATAQRIAAQRDSSADSRATTMWTAVAMNLGFGAIGAMLIWPSAHYYFSSVMRVEDMLRDEMLGAVLWLALAIPLATVLSVLNGAMQGREKFLELNLISASGTILFQVAPLTVALIWGPDLRLILPAALAARLLSLVVLTWRCLRHVSGQKSVRPSRDEATHLLRFGGWVTISSIISPMMVISDRIIIGALMGAKSVALYTVPFQLGTQSTVLAASLSGALFPRMVSVSQEEKTRLAFSAIRVLVAIVTPTIAIGIVLVEPFFSLWISPDFAAQSAPVAHVLLLGFWINGLAAVPSTMLQAGGRPHLVAKAHLIEIIPYIACLYIGLHFYGLVGAAVAFSSRVYLDFILIAGFGGMLRSPLKALLLPLFILSIAAFIATFLPVFEQAWWLSVFTLFIITSVWLAALIRSTPLNIAHLIKKKQEVNK